MKIKKTTASTLSFIGAAINQGQKVKGVEKGPDLIRNSGLFTALKMKHNVKIIKDYGNINMDSLGSNFTNTVQPVDHLVNNLHILDPLLQKVHNTVRKALQDQSKEKKQNDLILTVGGDHSIGSATISGMIKKYQDLKVVWVDAHPDFVNPYIKGSPSQNYHGMPVSHLVGQTKLPGFKWLQGGNLHPRNLVYIAIRDIDDDEWENLKKHNIKCFTMDQVTQLGIGSVMTETLSYLDPSGDAPFHISFDVDGADAFFAGQTGTVFRDGLNHRQSCHIVRRVAHQRRLVSMDVVQINEDFNIDESSLHVRPKMRGQQFYGELTETVGLGVDLVESVFTKYLTL